MKLKFFGYVLFIAMCIVFSLYVHFPGNTVSDYIEHRVSQLHLNIKLDIDPITPCFPLGLKTKAVQARHEGNPLVTMENVRSVFDVKTLFATMAKASFKADVLEGILSGRVGISRTPPRDLDIETSLEGLKLKQISLDKSLADVKVSGLVSGKIAAAFKKGMIHINDGQIKFTDLVLDFAQPRFSVETYFFSTGNIKFDMPKDNIIRIDECTMTGRQTDIRASGTIHVDKDFQDSILDIKAKIILYPLFFMNAGDAAPVDVAKNNSDNAIVHLNIGGTIKTPLIVMDQGAK
jgi:type II secretion system protein N